MTCGKRLRAWREEKAWLQYQLEQQAGGAHPVMGRLEAGNRMRDNMSVGVAIRLARALGVSVDHLIGMYDDPDDDEKAETAT